MLPGIGVFGTGNYIVLHYQSTKDFLIYQKYLFVQYNYKKINCFV